MSTPTQTSLVPQKRPRPVKACLSCRERKLKCDRENPCSQCVRVGRERGCTFDENIGSLGRSNKRLNNSSESQDLPRPSIGPSSIDAQASGPSDNNAGRLSEELTNLHKRLLRLERMAEEKSPDTAQSIPDSSFPSSRALGTSNNIPRTYHGLNNARSMISLFPNAQKAINSIFSDTTQIPLLRTLPAMFPKDRDELDIMQFPDLQSIMALLPPFEVCNELMELYMTYYEGIYQPLRSHSFLDQYKQFKVSTENNDTENAATFVPLLLLVTIIGSQFTSRGEPRLALAEDRRKCRTIELWLMSLRTKQRSHIATTRAYALLALCKIVTCAQPIEIWRHTGDAVRLAIGQRLHKDPDQLDIEMTKPHAEGRRQLWSAIIELDIYASMSCGMPSLLQSFDYTCRRPNFLHENDHSIALSYNDDEANTSVQAVLEESWADRVEALKLVTRPDPNLEEVLRVSNKLAMLRLKAQQRARRDGTPAQLFKSSMLEMIFKKPMALMHTLLLQSPGHIWFGDLLSTNMGTISVLDTFDPSNQDQEHFVDSSAWNIMQAWHGDDFVRAAYCACLSINTLLKAESLSTSTAKTRLGEGPASFTHSDFPIPVARRILKKMVESFIAHQTDLREKLKYLMRLAQAIESSRPAKDDATRAQRGKEVFHRLLRLCQKRHAAVDSHDLDTGGTHAEPTAVDFGTDEFGAELNFDDFGFDSTPLFDWNLGPFQFGSM